MYVTGTLFFKLIQVIQDQSARLDLTLQNVNISEKFQAKCVLFNMTDPGLLSQGTCVESVHQINDHFYHYHHHHLLIIHCETVFSTNLITATANLILPLFDELFCSGALMYKREKPN